MSIAFELLGVSRDGRPMYRLIIGRKHEVGTAAYEITTTDPAEARAFLLAYVKDSSTRVEVTMTASGDEAYRLLGADPPRWTPPTAQT